MFHWLIAIYVFFSESKCSILVQGWVLKKHQQSAPQGMKPLLISFIRLSVCMVSLKNRLQQNCLIDVTGCLSFKTHQRETDHFDQHSASKCLFNPFLSISLHVHLQSASLLLASFLPLSLFYLCLTLPDGLVSQDWVIDFSSGRLADKQPAHWCAEGNVLRSDSVMNYWPFDTHDRDYMGEKNPGKTGMIERWKFGEMEKKISAGERHKQGCKQMG